MKLCQDELNLWLFTPGSQCALFAGCMAMPAEALDCINCIKSVIEGAGDHAVNAGSGGSMGVLGESQGCFQGVQEDKG